MPFDAESIIGGKSGVLRGLVKEYKIEIKGKESLNVLMRAQQGSM